MIQLNLILSALQTMKLFTKKIRVCGHHLREYHDYELNNIIA